MSQPYRQQIGLNKTLLERYLDEARHHDYRVAVDAEDRRLEVRQKLHLARSDRVRLANTIQRLQDSIDRWVTLIVSLTVEDADRDHELALRDGLLDGDDGVTALIGHAQEFLDVLDSNIIVLELHDSELREQSVVAPWLSMTAPAKVAPQPTAGSQMTAVPPVAMPPPTHATFAPNMASSPAPTTPPRALGTEPTYLPQRSMIQLPKLQLVSFDGTVTKWQQFWDTFRVSIHEQPLPPIQKMTYLLSTLKGEAKEAVAGYAPTELNYPIVIALLQRRFGNPDRIRFYLHAELRALPPAHDKTADVRKVFEQIERICRQLEELGDSADHPQVMIAIEAKMPAWMLTRIYEEKQKENAEDWTVVKLRQQIEKVLQLRENVAYVHNGLHSSRRGTTEQKMATSTYAVNTTYEEKKLHCVFCDDDHWSNDCHRVVTRDARLQKATDLRLCFNCLKAGHSVKTCNSRRKCYYCQRRHHSALCPGKAEQKNSRERDQRKREDGKEKPRKNTYRNYGTAAKKVMSVSQSEQDEHASSNSTSTTVNAAIHYGDVTEEEGSNEVKKEVLLLSKKVILVNPLDPQTRCSTTAFFDIGSQLSFITTEVAQKLRLVPKKQEKLILSTFGATQPNEVRSNGYEVGLQHADGFLRLNVSSLRKLTDYITAPTDDLQLKTAASLEGKQVKPGILIGADYFWDIVNASDIEQLPSGFRRVTSKIGSMICGKGNITTMMAIQKHNSEKTALNEIVEKFWNLESVGVMDEPYMNDDDIALQQFQQTIQRKDSRYVVHWPWKDVYPQLPTNYVLSLNRLKSTVARLNQIPDLLQKYNDIIQEQLRSGIIEPVQEDSQNNGIVHYLPHHPVITPHKTTTKIRIVYDASAKSGRGTKSLNDCLYRGPVLLPDLCGMLIRFRFYAIAIVADVEKAFLQLCLEDSDRDVVRFLWLKDISAPFSQDNLQIYRFCRVAFGIISSPFLLAATIQHHLKQHGSKVAEEIAQNVYADNILMEAADTEEARRKCIEAKAVFGEAQMNLREFTSNDEATNQEFADTGQKEMVKFLGIPWNTKTDTLLLRTPLIEHQQVTTKRQVLQTIASVYDPLGLLGPALLPAKHFLQRLWAKAYTWDQSLLPDEDTRWKEIALKLGDRVVQLPRNICQRLSEDRLELHTFVDASAIAYAAAVYIRQTTKNGTIINLLYAKSRLCPLKSMTIPRLELMAAVIGVRITKFALQQLQQPINDITLWTDSKCVLGWIASKSSALPKFIANRLQEIRSVPTLKFRYVPTNANPADLGSRGLGMDELKNSSLWWNGPEWLCEDSEKWPPTPIITVNAEWDQEANRDIQEAEYKTIAAITSLPEPAMFKFDRWNSWRKMMTVMSMILWILKCKIANHLMKTPSPFWKRLKDMKNERNSAELLLMAEEELIRQVQMAHPPSQGEVNGLQLLKDNRGLLICKGRLNNSELPIDAKEPVFLPRRSRATELIILDVHEKILHSGVQHTLIQLRQRFWIPRGRMTVKTTINKLCMVCRRNNAKPYMLPIMPALPKERVTQAVPFQHTGLDYLGPLIVKNNDSRVKVWICLFTCFVTRAIHLEYVLEMTAEAFINAFRKFVARRGRPDVILSDNARQFQLVDKTLSDIWSMTMQDSDVLTYFAHERIKWRFTPALAPWHGGVYERMVAMIKKAYKSAIGRKILLLEQFAVILTEIEAVVNSRPLTYVGDEIRAENILRPVDFLIPRCNPGMPTIPDDSEEDEYRDEVPNSKERLIASWRKNMTILDHFWHQWHFDYLTSLRERQQLYHRQPRSLAPILPCVGEVVLIHDDLVPRGCWRLGKIEEIVASQDGEIRVAKVHTANGQTLQRAINHLYPLEVNASSMQHQNEESAKNPRRAAQSENASAVNLHQDGLKNENSNQTRYSLRPRRQQIFFLLAIILSLFTRGAMTIKCPEDQPIKQIYAQTCVQKGIVIGRLLNNTLCWKEVSCPNGSLRRLQVPQVTHSKHCGPPCTCPKWTETCSFYDGPSASNSTISDDSTSQLINSQRPKICSLKPKEGCEESPVKRQFHQIQLYDGSKQLVRDLHLSRKEFLLNEYECFGSTNSTKTGSSSFCELHPCDPLGAQYCVYPRYDATFWITDDGTVAVKAWGTIEMDIYDFKRTVAPVQCDKCRMECVRGGVTITTQKGIDVIDVSCHSLRIAVSKPREEEMITFPAEIVITHYQVEVAIWEAGYQVKKLHATCEPNPYCEMIQCYFCHALVANPQCAPKEAILVVVVALYLLSLAVYIIAKMSNLISRGFRCIFCCCRFAFNFCTRRRTPVVNRRRRSLPHRLTLTIIICLLHVPGSHQCSETTTITASEQQCAARQQGQMMCSFEETTTLTLQPIGQQFCMLLQGHDHRPAGTMKLEVAKVELGCQKVSRFFSRQFDVRVTSQKRCPLMGSCHDDVCEKVKPNETISELGESHMFPGYTGCVNACGCWGCGCFICSAACVFYRVYALPTTAAVWEVYDCPTWKVQLKVNASLVTAASTVSQQLILEPGRTTTWNKVKITLTNIDLPPTPTLASTFVTDGKTTAVLDKVAERAANLLTCPTPDDASNLKCHLQHDICNCQVAGERMNCLCRDTNALNEALMNQKLPTVTGGDLWLFPDDRGVLASLPTAAASVRVSIHDMTIITKIDIDMCHIEQISLHGCYNCENGAELAIKCQTDFGRAVAHVSCATAAFHLDCSPEAQLQMIRVRVDRPEIDEICNVVCPAASTTFRMQGTLVLVTTVENSGHYISALGIVTENSLFPLIQRTLFGNFSAFMTTIVIGFTCLVITMILQCTLCQRYR